MTSGANSWYPAISAHRGGSERAAAGTYESYRAALDAGADYVEFDVRRTWDGALVACHRARAGWGRPVAALRYASLCDAVGFEVPRVMELIQLLAGRAIAHVDLKEAAGAAEMVEYAAEVLGPAGFIVTTRDNQLAASVKRHVPGASVGVTIGGDLTETVGFAIRRARRRGVRRLDRVLAVHADWAVIHHRLARASILEDCQRRGIKTMVWTVNRERALVRWLANPGVDVVVTDRPVRALALRGERGPAGERGAAGEQRGGVGGEA